MKKVVIITDGDDFRAYRLRVVETDHGAGFRSVEIKLPRRAGAGSSRTLYEEALRGSSPGGVRKHPRVPSADGLVRELAGRVEAMLRKERPDVWNLVAPPELQSGLAEAVDPSIRKRLASAHLEDLLAILPSEGSVLVPGNN